MYKAKEDIYAIVAPKQKIVKICSRSKKCVLKQYRFKEEIPKVEKVIQRSHDDCGAWSVSERHWTTEETIMVYSEDVIESIRERALEYYYHQ